MDIVIVESAPEQPTQSFRRYVNGRLDSLSPQDLIRLETAFVAVGGHTGAHSAFIYYHHIRRIRNGSTGRTFRSELAFIRRIPLDNSIFPWVIWDSSLVSELQLPSPPSSPIRHTFSLPIGGPQSLRH